MKQTSIPLRTPLNNANRSIGGRVSKSVKPTQSLGEILWPWFVSSLKSTLTGLIIILGFIFAPIWNHPLRLKQLTHLFIIAVGIICLLWTLFWLGQRPVFNIEQIQVESANHQDIEHIKLPALKAQVISHLSGNFFSIHLDDARSAFEELPWVRKASVRRVWPNQLQVLIEEHEPVGVWMTPSGPQLINTYGELFTVNLAEASQIKGLVAFQGPANSNKEVLELYQQLNQWLAPFEHKVIALNLSSRYSWTAKLENGMNFELGRDLNQQDRTQMKERIHRFMKVWPEVEKKLTGSVDYVDLRYNRGFALRTSNKSEQKSKDISLVAMNALDENLEELTDKPMLDKPISNKLTQKLAPRSETKSETKAETKSENKLAKNDTKKVNISEKVGRKN